MKIHLPLILTGFMLALFWVGMQWLIEHTVCIKDHQIFRCHIEEQNL